MAPVVAALVSLAPKILDIVGKRVTDRDEASAMAHEIATAVTENANEIALAQIKTNQQEATHRSLFVAGWRPSVGWVSTIGLAINYLAIPLVNIHIKLTGGSVLIEQMDLGPLLTLLTGMLGFGALRTYEKGRGLTR